LNEAGWSSPARWRSLHSFGSECRLVPEGLSLLLGQGAGA
jgi:hypothetical protein